MSIELAPSGFHEWHDYAKRQPGLGIDSSRVDECLAHYRAHNFQGLFGSPSFGFAQDNLDFLAHATNCKWLWFWDVELKHLDSIYDLSELEHMGIHPKRPGIDFSRFPKLKTVAHHWIKQDTGLTKSKIKTYYHWHFKPKEKSFERLELPKGVRHLEFNWANPTSLAGLPVLKQLRELQFHRCRNLSDLSELPRIAPKLEKLLIATSAKVDPTAGVMDHETLKTAWIDGRERLPE